MISFRPLLLKPEQRFLLKAAIGTGADATQAFQAWRKVVPFDNLSRAAFRAIPLLVNLVIKEKLDDRDFLRMKGIERHIWAANALKLRSLFKALDVIENSGVPAVLLKGGALMARMPQSAGLRVSGDYDILIEPSRLPELCNELKAHGFRPKEFEFEEFFEDSFQQIRSGAEVRLNNTSTDIDIHWRPLPQIRDSELTARIFQKAEQRKMHNRVVAVPSATDHLFTCIARCEPWDKDECITRLIEADFLLTSSRDSIDWDELSRLIERYGLEALATAFFDELTFATDNRTHQSLSWRQLCGATLRRQEWKALETDPGLRSSWQRAILLYQDKKYSRNSSLGWTPTLRELWFQALSCIFPKSSTTALWRSVSRRVRGASIGKMRFLHGFSYPEATARWTDGHFSFMAVPLTDEQRAGKPVEIYADALGVKGGSRIIFAGGLSSRLITAKEGMAPITLSIQLHPLDALGGDGLLLFWMPDASSPKSMGLNPDARVLSLYIHRVQPDVQFATTDYT